MRRKHLLAAGFLGSGLTLAFAAAAPSAPVQATQTFEVTITNLTPAQPMSPILAAMHTEGTSMFQAGEPASSELALLAEEGDNSSLFAVLSADPEVHDVQSGTGMIGPGESETITLTADGDARFLSLAGMLVTTNDVFAGVDSLRLTRQTDRVFAFGYDAGSEANSELCRFIPGPPCMSAGSHDPAPAEGFIAVSNGIHGIGDVDAPTYDWRGPVAEIEIRRL